MNKITIDEVHLKDKRVLVRVDFNVPLDENLNVTNDIRIKASLPTINKIINDGGKAILMSHLGRPKGERNTNFIREKQRTMLHFRKSLQNGETSILTMHLAVRTVHMLLPKELQDSSIQMQPVI
jgi:3-phosphoglycerate kinase